MSRRWRSFNSQTTNRELSKLPLDDRLALYDAMEAYRDNEGGYRIESYGNGLLMLTDAGRGQGRCLFFKVVRIADEEILVALLFYKKESAKAPRTVIETARSRMDRFRGDLE